MKGTPSQGRKNKGVSHMTCSRCGKHAFHKKKSVCSSCGFGKSSKIRANAGNA